MIKVGWKTYKCGPVYKILVKSKRTGKWELRMFGKSLSSVKHAVKFYKEKFGRQAKIVKATHSRKSM